jgi:hypothetical protein
MDAILHHVFNLWYTFFQSLPTFFKESWFMMTIEQIIAGLQDRKVRVVAAATGLHYSTVLALQRGRSKRPRITAIQRLSTYLSKAPANGRPD